MYKHLLLASCGCALSFGLSAQNVLFSEDFQGGTWPANIILHNVDGLTPAPNVSAFTNAWNLRDEGNGNSMAGSTSWYSPAGQADDWMVIPGISISNSGTVLTWMSRAQDASFPDGYEVLVSTTGTDPGDFTNPPVFSVAADATTWGEHSADLSAYAGSTINIAFRNNSNDMFILYVDDIAVLELNDHDAALTAISTEQYHLNGSNVDITGTITNAGANAITAIDIKWSDGTTTYTHNMTGLNIPSLGTYDFTHTDQLNIAVSDDYDLTVWVELANDADNTNDEGDVTVTGVDYFPTRNIVGEEATGTWCGWCPRGHVWMEYMADNYPDRWIGIGVHNGDPMVNDTYDSWMAGQIGGYPSGVINRQLEVDPSDFEDAYNEALDAFAFADIEMEATMTEDRTVTVDISADFAGNVNRELRFAGVVIEDDVTGTSSDYDQVNYYSFQSQNIALTGAGHDWQAQTNPVPAAEMLYEDVARELLGGIDGEAGSIPNPITAGAIVTHTFTHSLSPDYNEEHVRIAVLMIDQESGAIVNAAQADLQIDTPVDTNDSTVGIIGLNGADHISIYPNPANNQINIDGVEGLTQVKVFDMTGRLVMNATIETSMMDIAELKTGLYTMMIENGGAIATRQLQIVR